MHSNQLPLVSVCCLTYNHSRCIRQTLDGFLAQKTTFRFEILIHDDASTDNTAEIIGEYVDKNPELIRTIIQTENQYSKGIRGITARFLFPIAKGKYIALCEGDDYWIDPMKLQLQVDFMESHPDYGVVHTDADFYFETRNVIKKSFKKLSREYVPNGYIYEQLLRNNFIYTLTICFRKDLLGNDYQFLTDGRFAFADYPLLLELSLKTKFHYIDRSTAVYRRSEDSMSHFNDFERYLRFEQAVLKIRKYYLDKQSQSETNVNEIEN